MNIPGRPARKRRYWRIVVGLLILLAKLGQFATVGPMESLPGTAAYHAGAYVGDAIIFSLIAWLMYSGLKPAKPKRPD